MRVLCLHPASSSALQLSQSLSKLEDRLWNKHGIELVFVDGPLLDVHVGREVGVAGGGIAAVDSMEDNVSRRWYVEECVEKSVLPSSSLSSSGTAPSKDTSRTPASSTVKYAGLDASLLHLSQIWTRGGANVSNVNGNSNTGASTGGLGDCLPFQGVLGFGQGADVAGILPLLNHHEDGEDSDDDGEGDIEKENRVLTMFQGLQFVVLVDGQDILQQRGNISEDEAENEDVYVGPNGVHSLHVILGNDDTTEGSNRLNNSERLAMQYGPNAQVEYYKRPPQSATNDTTQSPTQRRQPPLIECTPILSNILGKYLVAQKNTLNSNPNKRELLSLQNQLANLEQLASLAISQEIQRNPPKALMAVIGPVAMLNGKDGGGGGKGDDATNNDEGGVQNDTNDDVDAKKTKTTTATGVLEKVDVGRAVGAWQGPRRRGRGEEGGGAPCPQEFLLREEVRPGQKTKRQYN